MPSSCSSEACVSTASWTLGSKSVPALDRHLVEAVAFERAAQLPGDELQTGDQLALLVPGRGVERPAHVVHDRQQGLDDGLGGAQAMLLRVALHALAVVVELRLQAPQMVEIRVAVGGELGELAVHRGRVGAGSALARRSRSAGAAFGAARRLPSSFVCFLSVMSVVYSCLVRTLARPAPGPPAGAGPAGRRRSGAAPGP